MSQGTLEIVKPGLLTSVQDLGRHGHQDIGVPVAGPMDVFSHRLANLLVGNDADAATLEVTLIGPEMVVDADITMAISGAVFEVTCDGRPVPMDATFQVRRGQRLRFGRVVQGARAYIAIAGGVLTAPVLGSRATHLVSRMGGLDGRALQAGDRLPVMPLTPPGPVRKAAGLTLPTGGRTRLRVMPGPQDHWFRADALRTVAGVSFCVSPRSNRMGYRLQGPPLPRANDGELISEPVGMGAIQVPAAGEPILLMADRQTAGGYPKIGHVISADLPLAGQLAPGDFIEFILCTRQEALAALIGRERQLLRHAGTRDAS
ncbi:MAG: biotin-dependent carboxyltransferase family protein [Vicinamibacterales bacterium]